MTILTRHTAGRAGLFYTNLGVDDPGTWECNVIMVSSRSRFGRCAGNISPETTSSITQ